MGTVSFAILFAAADDDQARMVAGVPSLLRRDADPVGPGRLPLHLLLLSRSVLQSLLGRSAVLRCRRAAQILLGRTQVPADHSKRASLLPVSGAAVHRAA